MSEDDGFEKHQADYWRREYQRVQAWLQRIGDGRITIDPECLNPANVVPLAAWLSIHIGEASLEFPDERERRERAGAHKAAVADMAALRAKLAALLATLKELEAYHRKAEGSPAHGYYSFERAEAYEHAADLLETVLEEDP